MVKGRSGRLSIISGAIAIAGFAASAGAEGDAARGEQIFKRCAVCHALEPGKVKIGPPLHGVFGRKAGSVKGFRYSKAMKSADIVWTADTLDKYLAAPKAFVPGNRMPFPGLKNAADRADLLAYLQHADQA